MKFKEKLGKEMLICDGAMGTLLIENGLKAGELPEMWNIEHPDILYKIHKQYVDAGADIIMLDNMSHEDMREAMNIIGGKALVEVSGNVTKENIAKITDLGVDFVSSGALTHSAPIMDISLKNLHPVQE